MALVAGIASASAFPTITLNPKAGSTLDDAYKLKTFNVSFSETGVTVNTDKTPYLESLESGDQFDSTSFTEFYGTILIKFDQLSENGDYELVIPAGAFAYNGEESPEFTATYTLADANLEKVSYEPVTINSVTPADGSNLALFGGDLLLTINTSNNKSVGYMKWSLYDVTDSANPEYLREGQAYRYERVSLSDVKDNWGEGDIVAKVSGSRELLEGHKYELNISLYALGFDPQTLTYYHPDLIKESFLGDTKVYYNGSAKAYEYSPAQLVSITPNPDTYEIEKPAFGHFTATFSQPVTVTRFELVAGAGGVGGRAGTFTSNEDRTVWTLTFSESVLGDSTGALAWFFAAKDDEGRFLKGNMGQKENSIFTYATLCNIGAPDLISASPEDGAEVESLSEIIIKNASNLEMNISYVATSKPQIVDQFGTTYRTIEEKDVTAVDDYTMKFTFEPIVADASDRTYVLIIPSNYFSLGTEFNGCSSKSTTFEYVVKGESQGGPALDFIPVRVDPAPEATISKFSGVDIYFEKGETFFPTDEDVYLYKDGVLLETIHPNYDWDIVELCIIKCAKTYTEKGEYVLECPQGVFGNEAYMQDPNTGRCNPAISYKFNVDGSVGIDSVEADVATGTVYTVTGIRVMDNADAAAVKNLPAGIYIVDGKKVLVK